MKALVKVSGDEPFAKTICYPDVHRTEYRVTVALIAKHIGISPTEVADLLASGKEVETPPTYYRLVEVKS